ncbi:hypothetical protein VTI74DRAFT_7298 [Chaetomium olivicolor]
MLDRIDRPLRRLAASARKEDERLGHRSLRKSTFSYRISSPDGHGFLNISGVRFSASGISLSTAILGSAVSMDLRLGSDVVSAACWVGQPTSSISAGSPLIPLVFGLFSRPPGFDLRSMAHSLTTSRLGTACGSTWSLPSLIDLRYDTLSPMLVRLFGRFWRYDLESMSFRRH